MNAASTPALTERQQREVDYHEEHARELARDYDHIDYELVTAPRRRWWNQAWSMYGELLRAKLPGKRALVVGCGFGDDCFRLAKAGAEVHGFDLSPALLAVGRSVAHREGLVIEFREMPAERLDYPDDHFDLIVARDILHHVEIPAALAELRRVARPGARMLVNEVYTHSAVDRIRHSRFVREVLYERMVRLVYGERRPYITADERKMDERDMQLVRDALHVDFERHFDFLVNRVLPSHVTALNVVDYLLLNAARPLARRLGGRAMLAGVVRKASPGQSSGR
jgi:ubiquinone/menaquinone biosynthesis C-methylase UbiE